MFNAYLTLFMAFAVAGVVGWFSIAGIMTIYAGAPLFAALIMGIVIECTKLVSLSWLYRNWKAAGLLLRAPLVIISLVIMLITNIGVFGYLSKGHLEQGAATIDNSAKVEQINRQITQEQSRIIDSEKIIAQMDGAVNSLIGKDQANRSLSVRKSQASQRKQLREEITASQKQIDVWNDEKFILEAEVRKVEHEIGPIKYIAEVFIASDDKKAVDTAVQIFTLLIVLILDPAAVMLLLAANHSMAKLRNAKEEKETITKNISIGREIDEVPAGTSEQILSTVLLPTALESTQGSADEISDVSNISDSPTSIQVPEDILNEKRESVASEEDVWHNDILEQAGFEISHEEVVEEDGQGDDHSVPGSTNLSELPVEMENDAKIESLAHSDAQSEINHAQEKAILERFGTAGSFVLQTPPTSFIFHPSFSRVQYDTEELLQEGEGEENSTIQEVSIDGKDKDKNIQEADKGMGRLHGKEELLPLVEEVQPEDKSNNRKEEVWYWSKYNDNHNHSSTKVKKEIKTLSWLKTFGKE